MRQVRTGVCRLPTYERNVIAATAVDATGDKAADHEERNRRSEEHERDADYVPDRDAAQADHHGAILVVPMVPRVARDVAVLQGFRSVNDLDIHTPHSAYCLTTSEWTILLSGSAHG